MRLPCGLDADSAALLEKCVLIGRERGFTELMANALSHLGYVRLSLHALPQARACLDEALALTRQIGDKPGLVNIAVANMAELERVEGHLDAAEALYVAGLRHVCATGDRLRTMIGLNNLGMVAVANGDSQRARTMLIESLAISDELDSRRGRLVVMEVCAGLAAHLGSWEFAARFDGAADIHTVQMGCRRDIADAAFLAPFIERARRAWNGCLCNDRECRTRVVIWRSDHCDARLAARLEIPLPDWQRRSAARRWHERNANETPNSFRLDNRSPVFICRFLHGRLGWR